jgi:uncharacterized membrane protein YfcA
MSPWGAVLGLVAVALGAASQAVSGFGFALICAPMLSVGLGASDGVRIANLIAIGVNVLVVLHEWGDADRAAVVRLAVPALAVTPVAALVADRMGGDGLSVLAGGLVLAAAVALARGVRVQRLRGRVGAVLAGVVSGAMNTLSGVGGPVVASYAANAGWRPEVFRPTLGAYFLVLNIGAVLARGVPSVPAAFSVGLAVAVVAGYAAGGRLRRRLSPLVVRRVVIALAAGGGVAAILRGL